jgi:superoxide reductase
MIDAHYIMFIAIETTKGKQVKYLKPGEKPCAEFLLAEGEEFVKAYEYCNLHSLWSN